MSEEHKKSATKKHARLFTWTAIVLVIIGFALRISGVTWGIPFFHDHTKIFHPDEYKIVQGALAFPQYIWTNTDFRYPIFYHNFLGLILYPIRWIMTALHTDPYYYFYLAARLTTVLFSTLTLILTYRVAKRWFGKMTALLTTALFAFSLCYVQESAWATTDVMTSFFTIVFTILLTQIYIDKKKEWWRWVLAGIVFGFAYGTKYPAAILLVPLCIFQFNESITVYRETHDKKKCVRALFHWHLFAIIGVMIIAYLLSNAGIFWHLHSLIDSFVYEFGHQIDEAYMPYNDYRLYLHTWTILVQGFGWPVVTAMFFGFIYPFKKKVLDWACIVAIIGLLLSFGGAFIPRFTIVVAPYIMMMAARGIVAVGENAKKKNLSWLMWIAVAVGLFVFGYSVYFGGAGVIERLKEPREQAASYIDSTIPAGSSIGMGFVSEEYPTVMDWAYPVVDSTKYTIESFLDKPDYIIISSGMLEYVNFGFEHPERFSSQYVWAPEYYRNYYRNSPPSARVFKFYDKLLHTDKHNGYELIKSFTNPLVSPIDFMVTEIDIYKKVSK